MNPLYPNGQVWPVYTMAQLFSLFDQNLKDPRTLAIAKNPDVRKNLQGVTFPLLVESLMRGGIFEEVFCTGYMVYRMQDAMNPDLARLGDPRYREACKVIISIWFSARAYYALDF